jgi:hypothetical protein
MNNSFKLNKEEALKLFKELDSGNGLYVAVHAYYNIIELVELHSSLAEYLENPNEGVIAKIRNMNKELLDLILHNLSITLDKDKKSVATSEELAEILSFLKKNAFLSLSVPSEKINPDTQKKLREHSKIHSMEGVSSSVLGIIFDTLIDRAYYEEDEV